MGALTEVTSNNVLQALVGNAAFVTSTTPIRVRLMTANGSATAVGTEVVNSGGSTYSSQTATFGTAAAQQILSNAAITYANLPAATIVGVELWDSATTPKRLAWGALTASKTVGLGDSLTIAASALALAFI